MDLNIRLHLFIRKFDKLENVTEPYTYLGRVQILKDTLEGDCPVAMRFLLEHRIPDEAALKCYFPYKSKKRILT